MTALKQFARLETTGLWRPDPGAQRREVVVSFGDATLIVMDKASRPLTHWSLPAVNRLNPGSRPALFSPDVAGDETLELVDDTMIDAIETVRRSLARRRPKPGRLRLGISLATTAAVLVAALIWLPGVLARQALTALPAAKRSEIGATVLGHIQRVTGPTCRNRAGVESLARLRDRVLGPGWSGQVVVVPDRLETPLTLPGRIVVLSRQMVETPEDPAVVAGYLLAAATSRQDAVERLLTQAGIGATMTLLTTGDLSPGLLADHARFVLTNRQALPAPAALAATFEAADVPMLPWAATVGGPVLDLARERAPGALVPLMTDGDWIALQNICRS